MSGNTREESEWELREHQHMRRREEPNLEIESIQRLKHFCKIDTMHICTACSNGDRQKSCHFHIPSTGGNHCMELRFEEFCANQVLHQYVSGRISDGRADSLVFKQKKNIADINNRVDGYHVDFPLEGEETPDNIQNVYDQLCRLGMDRPEFWVDNNGKSASEYETFYVSVGDINAGKWLPKRKELLKDVLRYLELLEKVQT